MNKKFTPSAPKQYSTVLADRRLCTLKDCSSQYHNASVLIAIAHRNQSKELRRALSSALNQTLVRRAEARIAILDDQSEEGWESAVEDLLNESPVTLLSAECGSPARARNQLLDWADKQAGIQWVARLDADDELAEINSLETLFNEANGHDTIAVIGSNALRVGERILPWTNRADSNELLDLTNLTEYVERFSSGTQERELPSCNLMMKTRLGLRYPNTRSAEDHWLLCNLLIKFPKHVRTVSDPLFCIYSLGGTDTTQNKQAGVWQNQRRRLAYFLQRLNLLKNTHPEILGYGMEGIVWREGDRIIKEFYPWAMSDSDVERLEGLLAGPPPSISRVSWAKRQDTWQCSSPRSQTRAIETYIPRDSIFKFLVELYESGICALNIKRDNLRLDDDDNLHYIDIGKDICRLSSSGFLDMAGRLYSIGILGNDDEELVRRMSWRTQEESLQQVPGFQEFYQQIIEHLHVRPIEQTPLFRPVKEYGHVTLLIKACAQDADGFYEQISHIVYQLTFPAKFAQVLVLIDHYPGPFLRQYAEPNLQLLIEQTRQLKETGVIDGWLAPPTDESTIQRTYKKWFNNGEIVQTHTINNAPLYPQIWAFSELDTRYVLQCDCDVLVGRKDWHHDYLADMLEALNPDSVLAVGFNIPKQTDRFLDYFGEPGQFAPEVRFGLLDLHSVESHLPIENPIEEARFKLTWHRAIQKYQRSSQSSTCVRGGDPASFYIHPQNSDKAALQSGVIRDLISQGVVPNHQLEQFDLIPQPQWLYPERNESVIFLLKGRHTPNEKLRRCLDSLARQSQQGFGLIVIDDSSGFQETWHYPMMLAQFEGRCTLVRRAEHHGRMPNFLLAINEICARADSLVVVLDQDDFLMQDDVVAQLLEAQKHGCDLIQMPMYRPEKPLKQYQPDYHQPRLKGGGNTWAHLRAFQKSLFQKVPESYFKRPQGGWFDSATDYATMLPMSELAKQPTFLDTGYAYWHERAPYDQRELSHQAQLIPEILAKPSAREPAELGRADEECETLPSKQRGRTTTS
ncbi:glycosyltransferase family 2 protein [Marinobacter metalliresistant]|uniref:Glycosyltransferase n=1 Tax=Marinobacter metalliresistant TaxID=2961995 RepID=A0ABZ2VXY5_9GAMM